MSILQVRNCYIYKQPSIIKKRSIGCWFYQKRSSTLLNFIFLFLQCYTKVFQSLPRNWISNVKRDTVLVIHCSLKRLMTCFCLNIYILLQLLFFHYFYICKLMIRIKLPLYFPFYFVSKVAFIFQQSFLKHKYTNDKIIYYIRKSSVKFFNHHIIKFKQDVPPKATIIDFYNYMFVIIKIKSNRWNIRAVYIIISL